MSLVLAQSLTPSEILVIDSSSEDDTQAQVSKYPEVRLEVIDRSEFDHGGTRHDAATKTTCEIICFLTQDAVPSSERYLEDLIKPFSDHSIAMVTGRQLPKQDARPFEQLVRGFNYPSTSFVRSVDDIPRLGIKAFFASDVCSAYRRTAYIDVGGFDRPLNTNEDMLIASRFLRAGWRIAYSAEASVFHSHNLTPIQQYRRNYEVGAFLESHKEEFNGINEIGEGKRLVKEVSKVLISKGQIIELANFGLDCVARILGNRAGRRSVRKRDRVLGDQRAVTVSSEKS